MSTSGRVVLKRVPSLRGLPVIFDAVRHREFTRGSGNKKWRELPVNCQGNRALLQPNLGGSGVGTIPPGGH